MKCRAVLCLMLLSACTSTQRHQGAELGSLLAQMGYRPGQGLAAIERLDIHSWQFVDTRHLVLNSDDEHYLLTLFEDCRVGPQARRLILAGSGQLFTRVDPVVVVAGSEEQRCGVAQIQRLMLAD